MGDHILMSSLKPPLFELPEYELVVELARLRRSRSPVGAEPRPASLANTPRMSTIEMTPPRVSPALPPNEALLIGEDDKKLALDGEDGRRNVEEDGDEGEGKPEEEASER